MAKRLIDANAADVERIYCYYGSHCTLEDVQQWLDERPTVDAVEVGHGRWEPDLYPDGHPYRDEWYGYIFKCSVCGGKTMGNYDLECHENYCPNCGSKMDGGKDGR